MKKIFLISNIWRFIEAAILIALGIVTIIFAGNADFKWIIGLIASITLIVDGSLHLIFYFFKAFFEPSRTSLVVSAAEITFGIFLIVVSNVNKTFVVDNFTLLVALLLVVFGSALIIEGIAKAISRMHSVGGLIAQFIIGALMVALGIVALIFLSTAVDVFLVITGVVLILAGLALTFVIILAFIAAHKVGKSFKEFMESDYDTITVITETTKTKK